MNCTSGALRLVDGGAIFEGRLEICIDNEWGTVCDDAWESSDAMVACTQLGFLSQGRCYNNLQAPGIMHLYCSWMDVYAFAGERYTLYS